MVYTHRKSTDVFDLVQSIINVSEQMPVVSQTKEMGKKREKIKLAFSYLELGEINTYSLSNSFRSWNAPLSMVLILFSMS